MPKGNTATPLPFTADKPPLEWLEHTAALPTTSTEARSTRPHCPIPSSTSPWHTPSSCLCWATTGSANPRNHRSQEHLVPEQHLQTKHKTTKPFFPMLHLYHSLVPHLATAAYDSSHHICFKIKGFTNCSRHLNSFDFKYILCLIWKLYVI